MPEQTQTTETPPKQEPPKQSIQKKPFWKFILIFGILLLVIALGYIGFKFSKDGTISLPNFSQIELPDKGYADDSVLVLLSTYKKPDDKNTLYRVQLDGNGEKEIWTHTFFNDYQFSPLSFPAVSKDRKMLLYENAKEFIIINAETGKERKILKHHPDYFNVFDCIWNNVGTHVACAIRDNKSTNFDKLLVVFDIKNGNEIVVSNSTQDELIFAKDSRVKPLGWNKNDQQIYLSSTRGGKTVLLRVDINTKKVTSYKVGEKNIIQFFNAKYSTVLNKFVINAEGESTLYTFDQTKSKKEVLYDYKDRFIEKIYLSENGKYLIFNI